MRSFLSLGAPLDIDGERFSDKTDRLLEQNDYVMVFLNDIQKFIDDNTDEDNE